MTLTPEPTITPVEKARAEIRAQMLQMARISDILGIAAGELNERIVSASLGPVSKHADLYLHLGSGYSAEKIESARAIMAALGGEWLREVNAPRNLSYNYRGKLENCAHEVVIFNVEPIPAPEPI